MKKLLIIGAGFLQDLVIKKAVSMGYETLAVDGDPNAVGFKHAHKYAVIDIVEEKACLEYARSNNIDGVITAATDYGVLSTAFIAQEMELPGLKYDVAHLIKNKYLVRRCLYEHHVDDMEQAYEVDKSININDIASKLIYPVIVKPSDGSGSRGITRVDASAELAGACARAMKFSISDQAEIETFIYGQEYGAECLVVEGNTHVLGIMKKYMTAPPYYAELGHELPCGLPKYIEQRVRKCVNRAVVALGINSGAVNMDIIISPNGKVHIVDIGARMGGNMIGPCIIPYGTGIDYIGAMIQQAMGDPIDLSVHEHNAVATKLLAFKACTVNEMPDMSKIEEEYGVEIFHHMTEGMKINEYHTNLDGCGYVVANGRTSEEAERKAALALTEIKRIVYQS